MIGASLAVLASQNTLYAVRLALRFRLWLGTASAWLPSVSLFFFLTGVGAKSVLSIIPSSPRISTSFCHTWGTRKVQPKEPCPNCAPGTARDPCPCPDSADGPRALRHPGRTLTCAEQVATPQGYPRDRIALLTRYRVQSTLPPQRNYPRLLVPPGPRQRDGRPVVALRRGVTHVILIRLVVRHGASFVVQDRIQSAPTTKGPRERRPKKRPREPLHRLAHESSSLIASPREPQRPQFTMPPRGRAFSLPLRKIVHPSRGRSSQVRLLVGQSS